MAIAMTQVSSSQIEAIGYDEASKTLAVRFRKGAIYQYENVPAELYKQFSKADSLGKFFGATIKAHPGKYPFKKVPEQPK